MKPTNYTSVIYIESKGGFDLSNKGMLRIIRSCCRFYDALGRECHQTLQSRPEAYDIMLEAPDTKALSALSELECYGSCRRWTAITHIKCRRHLANTRASSPLYELLSFLHLILRTLAIQRPHTYGHTSGICITPSHFSNGLHGY